jgi:hypothetical protein
MARTRLKLTVGGVVGCKIAGKALILLRGGKPDSIV